MLPGDVVPTDGAPWGEEDGVAPGREAPTVGVPAGDEGVLSGDDDPDEELLPAPEEGSERDAGDEDPPVSPGDEDEGMPEDDPPGIDAGLPGVPDGEDAEGEPPEEGLAGGVEGACPVELHPANSRIHTMPGSQ